MGHGSQYGTLAPEALAPSRLLRSLGLAARKGLGQNFLASKSAIHHILMALDLRPDDSVIEVGAGLGVLTGFLAANAAAVYAVELDDALAAYLSDRFAEATQVRVVHADILSLSPVDVLGQPPGPYKVVGNLPYYITSAALRHVLSWRPAPAVVVVMVQLEVARRIAARPGEMSLLSLMVQLSGTAEIAAKVPAGAFVPPPQVDSAIVRIVPHPKPLLPPEQEEALFRLARAGFQQRRKTLLNSLGQALALPKDEIGRILAAIGAEPSARPQELSVPQWIALTGAVAARPREEP